MEEINEKEKLMVVKSAHSFLLLLCTSKKYGVSFSDKSLGTTNTTNNQLLLSVFEVVLLILIFDLMIKQVPYTIHQFLLDNILE